MKNSSIIKLITQLLGEAGYGVVVSKIGDAAQKINTLPMAVVENPTISSEKIEQQGFAKRSIRIALLEKVEAKTTEHITLSFERMETKIVEICNKLTDDQHIVEVSIKSSEPHYAKYTTMNETALLVKLELLTIY